MRRPELSNDNSFPVERWLALGRCVLPVLLAAYLTRRPWLEEIAGPVSLTLAVFAAAGGIIVLKTPRWAAALLLPVVTADVVSVLLAGFSGGGPRGFYPALFVFPILETTSIFGPIGAAAAAGGAAALLSASFAADGRSVAIELLLISLPIISFAHLTRPLQLRLWLSQTSARALESSGLRLDAGEMLRRWGSEIAGWTRDERFAILLFESERWIRVFPESSARVIPSWPEGTLSRTLSKEESLYVAPARSSEPYAVLFPFAGRSYSRGLIARWRYARPIWPYEIRRWRAISREIGRCLTLLRRAQKNREHALSQERARIAANLHDGFLQSLLSVKLHADVLGSSTSERALRTELPRARYLFQNLVNEFRQFLMELRPAPPRADDFLPSLREYAEEFQHRSGMPVDLRVEGREMFSDEQAEEATAIIREALTNIRKHAEARSVRIAVVFSEDYGTISISDDGKGFDLKSTLEGLPKSSNHGLIGMRQRVEALRGEYRYRSEPGKGTTLMFRIPLSYVEVALEPTSGKAS